MDFSFENLQTLGLLGLFLVYFVWKNMRFQKVKKQLPELISQGAILVDVRSQTEFKNGASARSLNIPLNELPSRLDELDKNKPIVLCCASGSRSGMAAGILKAKGFQNVVNAGSWTNTMV